MDQKSLFYDDGDEVGADPHDEVISSIAEIRELARDYFNLPDNRPCSRPDENRLPGPTVPIFGA